MMNESPKVVLLLGAGASVESGVPMVQALTDRLPEYVHGRSKGAGRALDWLMERLRSFPPVLEGKLSPDIELLLSLVREARVRDKHVLGAVLQPRPWAAELTRHDADLEALEHLIEDHIRQACEVDPERVDYLRPLRSFVPVGGVLDVFSLNYDCAVELVCEDAGLPCSDGFATYWEPKLLDDISAGIRLHKLHGSLLWFRTAGPPQRLVKIPVRRLPSSSIRFYSDDSVTSSVIYPAITKEQHVEPYSTLLGRFRTALAQADVLVSIGYSFRDRYLKELILEKFQENERLRLVVVDPNANDVMEASDRAFGFEWCFADIARRTLRINEGAGSALRAGGLASTVLKGVAARSELPEVTALQVSNRPEGLRRTDLVVDKLIEAEDVGTLISLLADDDARCWHESLWNRGDSWRFTTLKVLALVGGNGEDLQRLRTMLQNRFENLLSGPGRLDRRTERVLGPHRPRQDGSTAGQLTTPALDGMTQLSEVRLKHEWQFPAPVQTALREMQSDLASVATYWKAGGEPYRLDSGAELLGPKDPAQPFLIAGRLDATGRLKWLAEVRVC